jgi:excinuclease ABC subunit C
MVTIPIEEQLATLPARPGVYLMKDAAGKTIYVGKAVNLRHRVRSYFHASANQWPKTERLVAHIASIDWIVTESELEALVLECNLIKQHRPRFNVRFKDDKRYPYIKVTWQEDFPKVLIVRNMEQDGARYFGPFTASWAVHQTLQILRRVFPYLTCDRVITGRDQRACLYYDIGLCLAPCIGAASKQEYRAMIDGLCRFLAGKTEEIVNDLKLRMTSMAEALKFEQAARYRDQLQAIERLVERQKVVSSALTDQDVIAFARDDGQACVQVFFIRQGKLIGREYFVLEGAEGEDAKEVMTSFVKQFYDEAAYVPSEILLQSEVDEALIIESWLRGKQAQGQAVTLKVPPEGRDRDLIEMAAQNAAETLAALQAQWKADTNKQTSALTELQEALGLAQAPTRIECYDISNIQGSSSVGAMVVFVKGVPRKSDYRKFRIKTVEGPDDFAAMQEVLHRRLSRLVEAQQSADRPGAKTRAQGPGESPDPFTLTPDLVILDGGKGQLSAGLAVRQELGLDHIPMVALAKEREEIFRPGIAEPLFLPRDSQALYLVQRIRDEAHRFAITYHRSLREKTGIASQLDEIPGIGTRRRQALLKQFGSLEAIRAASVDELSAVPGMTRRAAEQVKKAL